MTSALIFDLDGTLIDSAPGIIKAAIDTLNELNYPQMSWDEIESCIGPPIGDSIGEKMGYTKYQIKRFYEVFRPLYKTKYLMDCTIYPGIEVLLENLKKHGYLIGVATNKREDYAKDLLDELDLTKYFDIISAMDMDGKSNKKDLIMNCINGLDARKEDTIMIGDSENDHSAAYQCGVEFIAALYGFGFKDHTPEDCKTVRNVEELKTLLLRKKSSALRFDCLFNTRFERVSGHKPSIILQIRNVCTKVHRLMWVILPSSKHYFQIGIDSISY